MEAYICMEETKSALWLILCGIRDGFSLEWMILVHSEVTA